MNKTKLLLAEDQAIIRIALEHYLQIQCNISVIATVGNGLQLIHKYKEHHPDIVLSDLNMPILDGFEASKIILKDFPEAKIILFTGLTSNEVLRAAISSGIKGIIDKNAVADEFIFGINRVLGGGCYINGMSEFEINEKYCGKSIGSLSCIDCSFTIREKEILRLIADGMTSAGIAEKLLIGKRTVDHHRVKILSKIGLKSASQLIKYAVENSGKL